MKWKTKRGWRSSHVLTFGCLCVASLSRMTCTTLALHAAADDLALEPVERGEERCRAVPFVIVRHGRAPALFQGQTGWVRSRACICDFSSTDSTTACAGGSM